MTDGTKGQLKIEPLVVAKIQCGACPFHQALNEDTLPKAAEKARLYGWKHTVTHGWLCAQCAGRHQQ